MRRTDAARPARPLPCLAAASTGSPSCRLRPSSRSSRQERVRPRRLRCRPLRCSPTPGFAPSGWPAKMNHTSSARRPATPMIVRTTHAGCCFMTSSVANTGPSLRFRCLESMQRPEPARLKPGVTLDDLGQGVTAADATRPDSHHLIRGKALVFWDPKVPGQETRRDRHRPDHSRRGLRLGEPRDSRRTLEGRSFAT